jgi:hypothetical protein
MQWQQPHYSRPFLIYVNIIKMDLILEKFSGKIDAKGVITMVEDIKREYLGDWSPKGRHPTNCGEVDDQCCQV